MQHPLTESKKCQATKHLLVCICFIIVPQSLAEGIMNWYGYLPCKRANCRGAFRLPLNQLPSASALATPMYSSGISWLRAASDSARQLATHFCCRRQKWERVPSPNDDGGDTTTVATAAKAASEFTIMSRSGEPPPEPPPLIFL